MQSARFCSISARVVLATIGATALLGAISVAPPFSSIAHRLAGATTVRVLLPRSLPAGDAERIFAEATAGRDRYEVALAYAPDCHGATVCTYGSLGGRKPPVAHAGGTKTLVTHGIAGYVTDAACGASCGDATLTFDRCSATYTVALKAGRREDLLAIARQMLVRANGSLERC